MSFLTNLFSKKRMLKKHNFHPHASGSIELNEGVLRVCSSANTDFGGLPAYKVFFLIQEDSKEIIGSTILKALSEYTIGIKRPTDPIEKKKFENERLKRMKIKSWKSYYKNVKIVYFSTNDNKIRMIRLRKESGGFVGGSDFQCCSLDDPQAIGQLALNLLED